MQVELVDWNVKLEKAIAHAGSVCYDSDPTDVSRVKRLKAVKHLSCFRHAFAGFEITISRACGDQVRTHQTLSHLMRSMRYCDEKDFKFVMPKFGYIEDEETLKEVLSLIEVHNSATKYVYNKLRDLGARKEDARCILPINTETKMYVSGNLQGFMHFIDLRTDKKAQEEIREMAGLMEDALLEKFPQTFSK